MWRMLRIPPSLSVRENDAVRQMTQCVISPERLAPSRYDTYATLLPVVVGWNVAHQTNVTHMLRTQPATIRNVDYTYTYVVTLSRKPKALNVRISHGCVPRCPTRRVMTAFVTQNDGACHSTPVLCRRLWCCEASNHHRLWRASGRGLAGVWGMVAPLRLVWLVGPRGGGWDRTR